MTYIEGRCVGGGSEINAALYHRPLPETIREWQLKFQIDDLDPDDLDPYFQETEAELSVSTRPDGILSPASDRLLAGAEALGWASTEIPRCWKYTRQADGTWSGRRQSMTETMVPRAVAAGCRLEAGVRVLRLRLKGGRATEAQANRADGSPLTIRFRQVLVCAGAVQTPLLLRRSGLRENIGDALRLHPMIRVIARFPEEINDPTWGVPVRQVSEFKPHLTLGCSHSSLPHLSMWGSGTLSQAELMRDWRRLAIFYVAAVGQGQGQIRNLPLFNEPLIRHDVRDTDMALLGEGLHRLGRLLFAAGASHIYSPVEGQRTAFTHPDAMEGLRTGLPHGKLAVSTIHLFSSCPMGEDRRTCAVDSYGRLHRTENIHIFDASILPASPGVNPQGTVMAVARRNTRHLLASL